MDRARASHQDLVLLPTRVVAGLGRRRAVSIRLEGLDVPVASIQDLIAMKTLAARPKDFEDIAALQAIEKSRAR